MRERRSRDRIILEILSICIEGENITRIVYRANTNFTTVKTYMDLLIKNGLIEAIQGTPILYKTTQKGINVRNRLKKLREELEEIDMENIDGAK
ncbi:MAG: winged helix-turn-helix domain-containing protein [Methanotrichaceae archaeon]